jgi:DnaJ-class molecular chaperone
MMSHAMALLQVPCSAKKVFPIQGGKVMYETCHECRGRGSYVCGRCQGSGYVIVVGAMTTFPARQGEPNAEECQTCSGSRYATCNGCNGKGQVWRGVEYVNANSHWQSCGACFGCGCHSCGRCEGRGYVLAAGSVTVPADRGIPNSQKCPTCHARRYATCRSCEGSGRVLRTT